jgi:hypothetical protein
MNALRLYVSMLGGTVLLASGVAFWVRSHRRTPEQIEIERRRRLSATGRIIDGTVLDVQEFSTGEGQIPVQLLIYSYDVSGVSYECSQDITSLRQFVDLHSCRIGLPASIKYDPHNPGNSIVVAEDWMGLRQ